MEPQMDLGKPISEAIKVETILANHYKVRSEVEHTPFFKRMLALLAEECALHAAKLRILSKTEAGELGNFAAAMDEMRVIKDTLGDLVLHRDVRALALRGMKLEQMLADFYGALAERTAELGAQDISSVLHAISGEEEHHCQLLRTARVLLRHGRIAEEEET